MLPAQYCALPSPKETQRAVETSRRAPYLSRAAPGKDAGHCLQGRAKVRHGSDGYFAAAVPDLRSRAASALDHAQAAEQDARAPCEPKLHKAIAIAGAFVGSTPPAAPSPKEPPRQTPHLSRAAPDHQETTRSAPGRIGQFRGKGGTHAAPPRKKGLQGRIVHRASRAQPVPTRSKRLESRRSARAPPEPAHTPKPLAGAVQPSAPRRALPRVAQGAAPKRRSPINARRTFEEPPGACVERARECYLSYT